MNRSEHNLSRLAPGLQFGPGTKSDLGELIRHHYRPGLPATLCVIRAAKVRDPNAREMRTVGVAALSWPVPMVRARNRHFGVSGFRSCLRWANEHVRTVSRVIVHPQYRAAGIAQELVRQLVAECPTRYIECSTSMGEYSGFLTRAGFGQLPTEPGEPAYFLLDRVALRKAGAGPRIQPEQSRDVG